MLFSGNCNTSIFRRLNCVIFGRLKDLIFGKLQYFSFWEIEMCYFREIEICHFREIELCHIREIVMYHFWETEMCIFRGIEMYHFRDIEFYSKNYLKAILKTILLLLFSYYYSINPIPYGERSSTTPLPLFVRSFFSVRATTLIFFKKCIFMLWDVFETFWLFSDTKMNVTTS